MSDINLDNPEASVDGEALIRQRCELRILRWKGSWVINPDKGIDYITNDTSIIAEDLLLELNEVSGVENVTITDVQFDSVSLIIAIAEPTNTDDTTVVETENFQLVLTYQEWNNAV